MKVYQGPYISGISSKIYARWVLHKYKIHEWQLMYHEQTGLDATVEKINDAFDWLYDHTINKVQKLRDRKVKIKIHDYDTWSMDYTLAPIILPMLKQLKETKHGAPGTDDEDVPDHLKRTAAKPTENEWDTDENWFKRWDWIMDEMIWAFEQKCRDNWEEDYYGPYIEGKGVLDGKFEWIDDEGRNAHQARMTNGFRLMGKYYESLWD